MRSYAHSMRNKQSRQNPKDQIALSAVALQSPESPRKNRILKYYILSSLCAALLDWLEAF